MAFYVTAGKDIFPLTINRSRYSTSSPCFSKQGNDPSCPTWYVFGKIGNNPSRLNLNEFGVRAASPDKDSGTNFLEIFFGSRTDYKAQIQFQTVAGLTVERTTLKNSFFEMINSSAMNFSYDGSNELFRINNNYNSQKYSLTFDKGILQCEAFDSISRNLVALDPYKSSVYTYAYDSGGASFAQVDGTWPQIAAGYNLSYFGQALTPGSAVAVVGSTGSAYFGFKVSSYYSSHEFGVTPSTDQLLWSLINRNGQYFGILVNNYETSYWAYDNFGTNLLWNSRGSGALHIWNDYYYNHFIISCSPGSRESAIWSKDGDGINLLWNSNRNGILQLWQDYSYSYTAFYIKNQASFWFSHSYYTDLKFSSTSGILQVWNTGKQSYIDLSVYMLEYGHVATFNYVYCKGSLFRGPDGRNVKIFSTHPIDICDPLRMGSIGSGPLPKKDAECVFEYDG